MNMTSLVLVKVFLVIVLMSSMFLVGITSSLGQYDPWMDTNDDGRIDMRDIGNLARMFGAEGTPINKTALLLELQARIDALNATLTSLVENACIVEDIVLVENVGTYEIPADYNVADTATLKIEHLPNLIAKLGGTTQAHVESLVKRMTIEVEAYAENTMNTFSGPCWTVPGALSEDAGKARWDLEFKNAEGSSYSTTDWKLLKVTTYLK